MKIFMMHHLVMVFFIFTLAGCGKNIPINLVNKEIKEETTFLALNCQYPELENGPKELNEEIKKFIDSQVKYAKDTALEFYQEYQKEIASDPDPDLILCNNGQSSLEINYRIIQLSAEYISLIFFVMECYSGTAHPGTGWKSFNYNLKSKKNFDLRDLFSEESYYLDKICQLCKKKLIEDGAENYADQFEKDDMIHGWRTVDEGWKKFDAFSLTNDEITLYFDWGAWHGVELVLLRKDII